MIVLASKSASRRAMLDAAGVAYETVPAEIDERALEAGLPGHGPDRVALALARAKAQAVSQAHPDRLVLGSDSLVAVDGRRLEFAGVELHDHRLQCPALSALDRDDGARGRRGVPDAGSPGVLEQELAAADLVAFAHRQRWAQAVVIRAEQADAVNRDGAADGLRGRSGQRQVQTLRHPVQRHPRSSPRLAPRRRAEVRLRRAPRRDPPMVAGPRGRPC